MVAEAAIRRRFRLIERHLDERLRRLVAAAEVAAAGSVSAVARATGVSRRAIRAGVKELTARGAAALAPGRIRRPGGGRKRTVEKRHMPGYVLVKMKMTDEAYHLIKNTPKVTGFLGAEQGKKPLSVPQKEVDQILGRIEAGAVERPRPKMQFEIGEKVRVTDGPFASFEGAVDSIDEDTGRLKVTVSIFGRATPVDLEYGQVQKV